MFQCIIINFNILNFNYRTRLQCIKFTGKTIKLFNGYIHVIHLFIKCQPLHLSHIPMCCLPPTA